MTFFYLHQLSFRRGGMNNEGHFLDMSLYYRLFARPGIDLIQT
uniref:Uncharacterized protein n=1 Tax=Rhizophora mucronata TaxID=61149 RepID=A0A2P2JPH3_RHIMU